MSSETIIRPKRKRRVVTEPQDTYSFNLPVQMMERFRRFAEGERKSYAEAAEEAIRLYLATKIHIPDVTQEVSNGRD